MGADCQMLPDPRGDGEGKPMKVEELKQACHDVIALGGEAIILVTNSCRLCGRRGPIGELLCEQPDGRKTVRFKAKAVLKFIEKAEAKGEM